MQTKNEHGYYDDSYILSSIVDCEDTDSVSESEIK